MHRAKMRYGALMSAAVLLMCGAPVLAQDAAPADPSSVNPKAAPKPAAPAGKVAPAVSGDAELKRRVEQLEEQLVDLQVVIGTLESLAKSPPSASARPAYSASPAAAESVRVQALETQIKSLTQQLEQLALEVRSGRAGSTAAVQVPNAALQPDAATAPMVQPRSAPQPYANSEDPIGSMIAEPLPEVAPSGSEVAVVPPPTEDPKAAYEAAYGHMLQQNYGAAQAGFAAFLKNNPNHQLVPNALYWLGETYYVQRNYADAAEAFDIVLAAHGSSNKAPDSQLKKAMSLSQLGKNAEACATLKQLSAKYPNAPAHVKTKADSERRRVGCT